MNNKKERLAKSVRKKTIVNRVILSSSRGWMLYQLQKASDFQVGLLVETNPAYLPDCENQPVDELFQIPVVLRRDFDKLAKPIDLRGNVPQQMADRLRTWASRLNEIATNVLKIPHEPYEHCPKAYVVRDKATGKLLGVKPVSLEAENLGRCYQEITNETAVIGPESIQAWPELRDKFHKLMDDAM